MNGTDEHDEHRPGDHGTAGDGTAGSGHGSLDFFGDSPSPTLPVPSTPAPTAPVPTAAATASAPDPAAVPGAPAPRIRRGLRVRTLVFGLVMLVISGASLLATLTSVPIDAGVLGLSVLIGAGALLLLGGLAAAIRDVRQGDPTFPS